MSIGVVNTFFYFCSVFPKKKFECEPKLSIEIYEDHATLSRQPTMLRFGQDHVWLDIKCSNCVNLLHYVNQSDFKQTGSLVVEVNQEKSVLSIISIPNQIVFSMNFKLPINDSISV